MLIFLHRDIKNFLAKYGGIAIATGLPPLALGVSAHLPADVTGMPAMATAWLIVAICWLAVVLDAGVWMFIALGRNGMHRGMERLRSAAWRGAVIAAPLLAFCLDVPPDYVTTVNIAAISIALLLGGFLWFHAIEG
jgi:hypothetical protein